MHFSESHEWVKVSGSEAIVGITRYAQHELGDIVYIELPKVGAHVSKGDEVAVLESTKAAADLYTPISGRVIEVNEKLKNEPELVNKSPEQEGWLIKVSMTHPAELDALMDTEAYQKFIG